jgi:hypothetical protein
MSDRLPRSRRNIIYNVMLLDLPFIIQVFKSHNRCYILFYPFQCMRESFHPIFFIYDSYCRQV